MTALTRIRFSLATVLVLSLGGLSACDGSLSIAPGESGLDAVDGKPSANATITPPTGGTTPGTGTPTQPGDPTNPGTDPLNPTDPTQPQAPPPVLNNATLGARCLGGAGVDYLVLSDAPTDCASDASRIDAAATSGALVGAVALPLDGATQFQQTVEYCAVAGSCETVTLDVTIDAAGSGMWSGTVGGESRTVQFTAQNCAYDQLVDPLPGDTPAVGISVDEVAVYQGVKVPVVEDGQMVNDLNAPIVAERPGVVRVFVNTEADWQERDVIVRLTLGDVVKEETFRPAQNSSEMDGDSTANFQLEPGELALDADFTVEIIEAQACADVPGQVAQPRVPVTGTQALGVQGLSDNMKIVLVPIQYNGDGSGRVPDLGPATVQRFREHAFKNLPVPDVEMTVRDAVSYNGSLSPNGAGFGEALNACLGLRANDNPANDVYYYCVFQPANSAQAFCGQGCVAGVAPVPGANDVGARAGIGISFGGDGEGVFVHELGHTLGRPHSPCGGAAGADPNYPYAQGLIGSWGYDIMSGQLFDPGQRADFMGYCDPNWVSDYTYDQIFTRLRSVIGAQQFMVATPPTRWRTAVIEGGQAHWGADKTLRHLPTGLPVQANLRDATGVKLSEPEVYITPVADIDAVLLTVEDTGVAGQTIEVPGFGQLML